METQKMETQKIDNFWNKEKTNIEIWDASKWFISKIDWLIIFEHIRQELEKFNDWKHFFIIHQTTENQAIKILQSPYFSNTWLNWTSLIANIDTIVNACYYLDNRTSWPWFQLHKASDSLVVMIISKDDFLNCRNLGDIDWRIWDFIDSWDINKYWLPNRCVWWYIKWVSYNNNHNFTWKIWQ